jgi:hypothetical protein
MKTWVTNGGYRIIQVLSGRSNIFLVTNGLQNVLIDTSPKSKRDKLESRLNNLDSFNLGFNGYILNTPGHSIGSMSIIVDDEIAIVGDAIFGVFKKTVFPPFSDDVEQMIKSWRLLLDTNCSVFIPAHGSSKSRLLVQNNYEKENSNYGSQ